jgi:alpha-beta hydrolase superfamily lysophospholipase
MASKNTNNVILVGHSLGGAIALLDAVFLRLQIPSANIKVRAFGLPRVIKKFFPFLLRSLAQRREITRHLLIFVFFRLNKGWKSGLRQLG